MVTPETIIELESRVANLEAKVERLQRELKAVVPDGRPWWQQIVGAFADDPIYEDALADCPASVIELWKAALETQRHFNDLQMRIRAIAVPVVLAAIGAAGFAARERLTVKVFGTSTSLGLWLIGTALLAWLAFYFMDRWWYHRLLLGAVIHSESIEQRWKRARPEIALAESIRRASPVKSLHSNQKIDVFYGGIALVLIMLGIGVFFVEKAQ